MEDERFEWDDAKSQANQKKHKISFDVACRVFDDQGLIDEPDESMEYDEDRYKAVGMIDGRMIAVIYTLRGDRIRLISARKATTKEHFDYARQNPQA